MALFDLVIFADWSAASSPGPERPTADACWLAWGRAESRAEPQYFRTRAAAEARIRELALEALDADQRCLLGFDFVFGLPNGIGPSGGRPLARLLAGHIEDQADNVNNRFAVAARLNASWWQEPPGPFWMCPAAAAGPTLTVTRPSFAGRTHGEYRLVEQRLRAAGRPVQSVWKLGGAGAVGSQSLLGLAAVGRLLADPRLAARAAIWPFETAWSRRLADLTIVEAWPGVVDSADQPYPIKDARQVAALRDRALALEHDDKFSAWLARPIGISRTEESVCRRHEGWILGA